MIFGGTCMAREEIVEFGKFTSSGALTKALEELEYCGFIRKYSSYGKKTKPALYQLIDNYTLFYFKFIRNNENNDEHFWMTSIDSQMHRVWAGLAFERMCLQHVQQIKETLGISGVLSNVYSWYKNADVESDGAQIDLLIDRNDQVINLCEMKFSISEYTITSDYEQNLRRKKNVFISETNTRKALHITMITTYGLKRNMYSDIVQKEVTLEDLFR